MEKYEYFLVSNTIPFFERLIPMDLLERTKMSMRVIAAIGVPDEYMELHARFNGGWLIFNPVSEEFE